MPLAYLITFRTYGTWLHGDERGSMDRRRFNAPGEPWMQVSSGLSAAELRALKHPPVHLTAAERDCVGKALEVASNRNHWTMLASNVRTEHVHVVVASDWKPETLMSAMKSAATRSLRQRQLRGDEVQIWSRHGSTVYLWDEGSVANAVEYVVHGQDKPRQPH